MTYDLAIEKDRDDFFVDLREEVTKDGITSRRQQELSRALEQIIGGDVNVVIE